MAIGVQQGTSVRLSYENPTNPGVVSDSFAISDGDFHDEDDHLSFSSGKVKVLFDSDRCNEALFLSSSLPEDTTIVQGQESVSEGLAEVAEEDAKIDYELDVSLALQDARDEVQEDQMASSHSKDGIFDRVRNMVRNLAGHPVVVSPQDDDRPMADPSARVKVVAKSKSPRKSARMDARHLTKSDVVSRHRKSYLANHAAFQAGRRMEEEDDYVETCSGSGCQGGLLTVDSVSGDLILNGNSVSSLFSGNTLGTAYNATTIIDNIDTFIIPAGAIVNVLGTLIVEAAGQIVIDGTLNGNGGGYVGAEASNTDYGERAQSGESPPDTTGQGEGGKSASGHRSGGGGGGHGMCLFCCLSLF